MLNVDVYLLKGGRSVGTAENRPVRLTPEGIGGVVYRGKVFPFCRYRNDELAIEITGISYSSGRDVCRLATTAEARRVIRCVLAAKPNGESRPLALRDNGTAIDSRESDGNAGAVVTEILGLLSIGTGRARKSPGSERDG